MDKENVLKAMKLCGRMFSDPDTCEGCPYNGKDHCDSEMLNDAIALLKANEPVKAHKPKYTCATIYTKKANLLPYLTCKVVHNYNDGHPMTTEQAKRVRESYAKEIDVQLIAMFRWENGNCYCKIRCPINPLPVKGEFEVPSMVVLADFLANAGWNFKQNIYPKMFE